MDKLQKFLDEHYGSRHYEVKRELGRGAMGTVYLVADNSFSNHNLAIKILNVSQLNEKINANRAVMYNSDGLLRLGPDSPDDAIVSNIIKEADNIASLKNHSYIVHIYSEPSNFVINDIDPVFFSMEYVEGGTLENKLHGFEANTEPSSTELISNLELFREVLEAICFAHGKSIVHCDLKPRNIMIGIDGHVKVADFGLSFHEGIEAGGGGSPGYEAPEIRAGREADRRSDIYSLGVILYELVTAKSPVCFVSHGNEMYEKLRNKNYLPSIVNTILPKKFDEIIVKMCQEDPDNRYREIKDIISDLKEAEEELNGSARNDLSLVGLKSSDFAVGSYVTFGRYPQNNSDTPEPIEWLVLRNNINQALLVSKYGLECLPFHYVSADIGWCDCDLRKWLNDVFFNRAFNVDEQRCILESAIYTNDNDAYSIKGCGETLDKVFCLSTEEAKHFFSSRKQRKCKPTAYAVSNGAFEDNDTGCCWYWLRSPGSRARYAARVRSIGAVTFSGSNVFLANGAVRPALRIKL